VAYVLVMTPEVRAWLHDLRKRDRTSAIQVGQAIGMLLEAGPELGRPSPPHQAEQPQGTAARLDRAQRDPHPLHLRSRRNAVLLVAGDKAGKWEAWYRQAIPLAEQRYEDYLKHEDIR
jgi:hypothetical protein